MTQNPSPDRARIPVLYEDPHLIVFNKPSGFLVVPSPRGEKRTLERLVNEQYSGVGERENISEGWLYPCHRLDRETSGAIIFARGKNVLDRMTDEFRKGTVAKTYLAFVRGKMKKPVGEIKSIIRDFHDRKYQKGSRGKPQGKLALTKYKVVDVKRLFTVVEVYPLTGRTNQIRIHFSEIGHPLLGERLYALGRDFPVKFPRVALHASRLSFRHPVSRQPVTVTAELAKDMENFWNRY